MNAIPVDIKKGDKVVKLLNIQGIETASIVTVAAVCKRRGLLSTDDSHVFKPKDIQEDGVGTYRLSDGQATANYITGCESRVVVLEA